MWRRSDGPVSGNLDMSCHLPFGLRPPRAGPPFLLSEGAVDALLLGEREAVGPARLDGRARGAEPGGEGLLCDVLGRPAGERPDAAGDRPTGLRVRVEHVQQLSLIHISEP